MTASEAALEGRLTSRPGTPEVSDLEPGVHELRLPGSREALLVVPEAPAGPLPLLVFLHGAGGNGPGSLPTVQEPGQARGCLVLLPTSAGSTWDLVGGAPGPDVAAVDAALAAVFARRQVSRVALAGFSDGASYALSLGLANGDLADTLLAFSPGFAAPPSQHGRPRVWVSHGTGDRVLPIDVCGRRVVRRLREAGYEVAYEEFDGPHVVPPHLVERALDHWLGAPAGP